MDYITVKEVSEEWGVTPRRVNYYCAGVWMIPKDAEKPVDGRTKQGRLLKYE